MKAALIGLGMVSKTYGDAFRNTEAADLSLVYSRTAARRAAFLAEWPGPAEVATIEDVTASDADFVILTTPPNGRMAYVEALVAAGKPILMEKPIERTLAAATELVELCERADVPLGIMLQHRARPVVEDLRSAMTSLGDLRAVEVNVPWWRDQAYYDEPGRGTYARDGGGVLISQAIHTLDLMLSLTGPVSEVTAMAATSGFHQMEAEDFVCAGLRFANGAVGQLFATTASFPGRGETITLHCAQGSAHLDAGTLTISRQDGSVETLGQAAASGAGADPMAFTSDWHRFVIEDFVAAIHEDRDPLVTGRDALEVHRLIAALESAAATGRRTTVEDS
ncbi:Gluconokinase [Candidatus Rhodobacter oscarellae]|uniref:Gluconokinase n=1 Tax=Candidatus Rhodobacter oscarellae TaxID=1675527 RepID=A0A0J9ECU9_9RHOB|nr:Gfo/Idh/MocA family oxidoreductase [Candidatus Rhodobacter lobularis]KMW60560.1 Gluconokinase [Candidatus Rhodobacter lobularis]